MEGFPSRTLFDSAWETWESWSWKSYDMDKSWGKTWGPINRSISWISYSSAEYSCSYAWISVEIFVFFAQARLTCLDINGLFLVCFSVLRPKWLKFSYKTHSYILLSWALELLENLDQWSHVIWTNLEVMTCQAQAKKISSSVCYFSELHLKWSTIQKEIFHLE